MCYETIICYLHIWGLWKNGNIGKIHSRFIYGLNEPVNISVIYVRNIIDIFTDLINP
jgi:hypothetical protein